MRYLPHLALLSSAILLGVHGVNLSRGETDPNNKQAEQSILGSWRADSVSMIVKPGERMTFPTLFDKRSFSVIIGKNSLAIWEGNHVFAEMSYDSNSQLTSSTIDGTYQNEGVLGIYELKGDQLKFSLNNVNNGRPTNYDKNANDCVLILSRFQGAPLFVVNADGTDLHQLFSLPEYTECNSPAWSPDGSKIALDCWRSLFGEAPDTSHVFVVNADGSSPKDLGDGAMPSWSPDGKQIAYCRYSPNRGVWIMNADGSDKRLIDAEGWSAAWSTKKDELAYVIPEGGNQNLCIRDLKNQEGRNILEKAYSQVYWALSWSPDGQWICFKGDLPDGTAEVAIAHAEGQAKGFKILLPNKEIRGVKSFENYPAWSPDGKQILLSMVTEDNANPQQYLFDLDGKAAPQKLAGQDPSRKYFDSSWSPDGKRILLSSWPGAPVDKNGHTKGILQRILNPE